MLPVVRGAGRRRARASRSTPARPPWPAPRWPRAPPCSTTSAPRSASVAAELGVAWAAMHAQGEPATMQDAPRYDDVVARSATSSWPEPSAARRGGCRRRCGSIRASASARRIEHNLALLAHLDELVATGYPVARRHEPQGVPRRAARRVRRHRRADPGRRPARGIAGHRHLGHGLRGRAWCAPTTCVPPLHAAQVIGGHITKARPHERRRHEQREQWHVAMKGKWAQGIQPRNFAWILKDKLAVCERPGGYGANHRRVRRQEEIIWIREQGFTCVVTLIPSPHNLHNYDELGVTWRHLPFGPHDDARADRRDAVPGAGRHARRRAARCWCTRTSCPTASPG